MSHYKRYLSYKDSGVEWIGEVPEHWTVQPVKHLYSARLGKMVQPQSKNDEDVLVPYHRAQTVQWERIEHDQVEPMWVSPSEIDSYSLEDGDLLICEGGDVCRAAIFNKTDNKPIIFQNSIHRVRPLNGNHPEWLLRLMQIVRSTGWIDVLCSKNTIVHFTSDKLASLDCPRPTLDEQQKILTMLRNETDRIDALISKKTRFIELLKEKRSAIITHAVTKGLDPNVKMKDSGVEWIGEVPEGWGVKTIKFVASCNNDTISEDESVSTTIRYVDISSVSHEEGIVKADIMLFGDAPSRARRKAKSGDVIVSTVRTYLKAVAAVDDDHADCIYSTGFAVIRARKEGVNPRFLKWLVLNDLFIQSVESHSEGLSYPAINAPELMNLKAAIPNLSEQVVIASILDRETTRIDTLITKVQRSIDLLKERRSALITAAVTGQIDLRNHAVAMETT